MAVNIVNGSIQTRRILIIHDVVQGLRIAHHCFIKPQGDFTGV
jgi:hypothetical protein